MAFRLVAQSMMRLSTLQTAQRVGLLAVPRLQGVAPSGPVSALRILGVNHRCSRSFAVSTVGNSSVDKELSEVLAAEIKHERENNDPTTVRVQMQTMLCLNSRLYAPIEKLTTSAMRARYCCCLHEASKPPRIEDLCIAARH